MTKGLAERFAARFEGLRRAYGSYDVPAGTKPDEDGKLLGPRGTRKGEVTVDLWEAHLAGGHGLGIVPINDESMARFGAIDVDVYPLDLQSLQRDVARLKLPLIVCRTKSGGAHLYLFLSEFADAELVRTKLLEWSVLIGHPGVEVFPKQTRLASENDTGNWINMPYAGGRRSTRYAVGADGKAMTPEGFLDAADGIAVSPAALRNFSPPIDASDEALLGGAPPCLRTLAKRGFGDWGNNGLFNVAVYLRKRYGDDAWQGELDRYNRELFEPPVGFKDVQSIAKSVAKKNYGYMCRQEPISSVCNRQVCLGCEFGVGGTKDDPGVVLGELVMLETEPPTWIWDVDGARLEVDTATIMDQRRFHAVAVERLQKWPNFVKDDTWRGLVRERLARVQRAPVPEDATKEGQLWVQLSRFCTGRSVGRSLDELLLGKPYTDEERGRTYFCSSDFLQYLGQHRMNGITQTELFRFLRKRGVEHHFSNVKGKGLNYWSVPAFARQTEDHDVPRRPPPEAM